MANWKVLGEVPDSEDEDGFESQNVEEAKAQPTIKTTATVTNNDHERDIWDFPDSEEENEVERRRPQKPDLSTRPPRPITPEPLDSSPISSALTDETADGINSPQNDGTQTEAPVSKESRDVPSFGDEVSTSFVRITAPTTTEFTDDGDIAQASAVSPIKKSRTEIHIQEPGHHTEEQEARQVAFRYERSLRPRKPIQEHPYLLENAQYSSFLREHGVRPVKVAVEAERRQREELPADDDDFEQESQGGGLPEVSDESQPNGLAQASGGHEELGFPSPSPQKTSPLNNRAGTSSLLSSQNDTDDTSVLDQDLPDLDQLLNSNSRSGTAKFAKRKTFQPQSVTRKRQRRDFVHGDLHEPDAPIESRLNSPDPLFAPIPKLQYNPVSTPNTSIDQISDLMSPLEKVAPLPKLSASVIDISSGEEEDTDKRGDNVQGDQDNMDTSTDSENEKELVTKIGRRIRGVLPASWLRLDQQTGRDKAQRDMNKRQRNRTPEREVRRGVAQPRQAAPGSVATHLLFEESDDEAPLANQKTTDDIFHHQRKLPFEPLPDVDLQGNASFDDGDSVVEEDYIDRMASGRKRQLQLSEAFHRDGKRTKTSNITKKQPSQKLSKQSKLTGLLQGSRSTHSVNRPPAQKSSRKTGTRGKSSKAQSKKSRVTKAPSASPPRLGILDIIEPDAPRFLRIAARTAKQRANQGRSSPRQKSIKLASRQDHIDAVSVLDEWRSGSIKQRPSVSAASQSKKQHRRQTQPLAESSGNSMKTIELLSAPKIVSRKLVKHVSKGGSISYQPKDSSAKPPTKRQVPSVGDLRRTLSTSVRPAQLETDGSEQPVGVAFHSRKIFLDRLFRKRDRGLSVASSVAGFETNDFDIPSRASSPDDEVEKLHHVSKQREGESKTSRFRKKTKPCHIDVEAPQYTHAHDPLPVQYHHPSEVSELQPEGKKLQGLGPYGTRYTHHFEIFPLDPNVYFHESTLIGSGIIEACMGENAHLKILDARPRVSFTLSGQVLRWGLWNDQVSSELGIILDFIAEQLESDHNESGRSDGSTTVDAASFILRYVKDSLSLGEGTTPSSFLSRLQQAFGGFIDRMSPRINQCSQAKCELALRIYDRLLLVSLLALRICRGEPSLMSEQIQIEDVLKSIARLTIATLLHLGTNRIKKIYEDLNRPSCRERGLRDDAAVIHSWVLLMKVLEHARIPRASFWDVVQTVAISPQTLSSVDVQTYERVWEIMFTLVPLFEFNDSGVVIAGKRHYTTIDGWTIPQKLVKRVFQLYQENDRQSPSFNNYCRALVGRCHYLVQQWGWRRSAPVVGVIFDFFGSQNLAHLRNEEVYKSPRFLEELAKNPSLDIEPDDRCFHIFLKLLALSIRKLRDAGSDKDIRNLVARTIPNHNRQYLKEQNVHERDLAALRNHHDLIGTLFWASPPDLRPAVTLIERLITPESSHKEACLINIRAWNQLARFVVATGEATTSFKPFTQWRNAFFQQMMQQFDSVAADINQQLLALSKDISKSISRDMVDSMISMNKAAVMEVLQLSVIASLDVMRHAPDLEAATFCLNTSQLQQVFKCFSVAPPELDWTILRTALATLDSFLAKVDEFKDNEESQQSESQILSSAQADDALLVVDHDLSRSYFLMTRCILSPQEGDLNLSAMASLDKHWCMEQVIMLSARMGTRFINGGLMRLSDMFKLGKYGLFDGPPHTIEPNQRKYLALFLLTLLKHGHDNFSDVSFSLCEAWALSLVKPHEYLEYENQLAEQLQRHGEQFVPDAVVGLSIRPDYNSNRDLFEFAISWMRRSVRDAGRSHKSAHKDEHAKTLRLVMEQIQGDLKVMSQHASHHNYVVFVRQIISLIKVHGSEICAVHDFFYQISKEYSPSTQDPQLQVAGMLSYGLQLQEGDVRAAQRLFYLLLNNFKAALTNSKLQDDVDMLRKVLKHQGIVDFVLGKMLPAIILASFTNSSAFPLMDVYVEALRLLLAGKVVSHELGESDLPHLAVTLRAIVEGMNKLGLSDEPLSGSRAHVMRQAITILNLLWPSLYALSVLGSQSAGWREVMNALEHLMAFAITARTYLRDLADMGHSSMDTGPLLGGVGRCHVRALRVDSTVGRFANEITDDIEKNWVVTADRIAIPTPGNAVRRGILAKEQGVEQPAWEAEDMVDDLGRRIQEWWWWWERFSRTHASVLPPML